MMKKKQDILLETGTNEVEIAEFGVELLDGVKQTFGINVAKVREIIKVPKFIQIPNAHKDVLGVFKLRDKIIPLINLGGWLNEKKDYELSRSYVIVTEFNKDNFGFLVHHIETIHRMSWEKVLPPATIKSKVKNDCITGVVLLGEKKIMMMMDFEKIVSDINPEVSLSQIEDHEIIEKFNESSMNPKVLLAEDSSIIRDLLAGILEKGGFEVVAVNNGKLALEYIDAWNKESKEKGKNIRNFVHLRHLYIGYHQMDKITDIFTFFF
jgi:two-component system chemotaxis response regulator CheV